MTKILDLKDIVKMTQQEKEDLAARMYNPIRCGGGGYDENGKYYLIIGGKRRNARQINQIRRELNPHWTESQLEPYLTDESI